MKKPPGELALLLATLALWPVLLFVLLCLSITTTLNASALAAAEALRSLIKRLSDAP